MIDDFWLGVLAASTCFLSVTVAGLASALVWALGRKDVTVIKSRKGFSVQASE